MLHRVPPCHVPVTPWRSAACQAVTVISYVTMQPSDVSYCFDYCYYAQVIALIAPRTLLRSWRLFTSPRVQAHFLFFPFTCSAEAEATHSLRLRGSIPKRNRFNDADRGYYASWHFPAMTLSVMPAVQAPVKAGGLGRFPVASVGPRGSFQSSSIAAKPTGARSPPLLAVTPFAGVRFLRPSVTGEAC